MKKITFLLAACAFITTSNVAQTTNSSLKLSKEEVINLRQSTPILQTSNITSTKNQTATVVFKENFDKFIAGNELNPDKTDLTTGDLGNIDENLTHTPGWSGYKVFQAGGKAYLGVSEEGRTGFLDTPVLETLHNNKGAYHVRFRARTAKPDSEDVINILNCIPEETANLYSNSAKINFTWKEYELPLYGATDYCYVELYANKEDILIDDFEIVLTGIPAPVSHNVSNWEGTSFTASWEPVEEATSYLLSVYKVDQKGIASFIIEDLEMTETTFKVDGLDKRYTHFYYVKAKNADFISCPSLTQKAQLTKLDTPIMNLATNITEEGYTANWFPVKHAVGYTVYSKVHHTATSDEEFPLLLTDFNRIETTATMDNPTEVIPQYVVGTLVDQPNWLTFNLTFANGMIGLDNTAAAETGMPAQLYSPNYDLSTGKGNITIEMDIAGRGATEAIVILNAIEKTESGEAPVTLDKQLIKFDETIKTQKITLKGGKKDSYILIQVIDDGIMFIDKLNVYRQMGAGESIEHMYQYITTEETSYNFSNWYKEGENRFSYAAQAFYYNESEPRRIIRSDFSEPIFTDQKELSNENIEKNDIKVFSENGILHIETQTEELIQVYDFTGVNIWSGFTNHANAELPQGIYIVRAGNKCIKTLHR